MTPEEVDKRRAEILKLVDELLGELSQLKGGTPIKVPYSWGNDIIFERKDPPNSVQTFFLWQGQKEKY